MTQPSDKQEIYSSKKNEVPMGLRGADMKGTDEEKLNKLINKSRLLYKIKSVKFLDIFPDILAIDENKIDIVYRHMLSSEDRFTALIKDIKYVGITTNLFFASLSIEIGGYEKNPPVLSNLKKDEALKARRILIGLIAAKEEKIDLTTFNTQDLVQKLEEIGTAEENSKYSK